MTGKREQNSERTTGARSDIRNGKKLGMKLEVIKQGSKERRK